MKRLVRMRRWAAASALAAALLGAAHGRAAVPGRTLRVGAAGSEPFLVGSAESADGLSVAVWRAVATQAGVDYELVREPSVSAALQAVEAGELDVAVGPISITAERAQRLHFTQPYFQARLSILAPSSGAGPWARFAPLLSRAFLAGIGLLLVVLSLVGTLLWLAERRRNPEQFPKHPVSGIGNGVWLALVTMTTVGYGDRVPVTRAGRIIAGVWMVVALISASSLTAGIATGLTLSQLDKSAIARLDELEGRRVAVVSGTTGADLADEHGARLVPAKDLAQAIARLSSGRADAVVFDRPMLQYYLKQHPNLDLELSRGAWEPQGYGFALRPGDALVHSIDVALLEVTESGQMQSILQHWLGSAKGSDG